MANGEFVNERQGMQGADGVMGISGYLNQSGQVWRRTEVSRDRYNKPQYRWEQILTVRGRLEPYAMNHGDSEEVLKGKDLLVSEYRWFMLPGEVDPEVNRSDRIRVDGADYEVVRVGVLRNTVGAHHLEVDLKKVE